MDSCGNCGKGFDGSFTLSHVLKILDFRNGNDGHKDAPEEIPISSALSLIYSQFKYDSAEESDYPIAFCSLCAHTLTVIYNAFKEFLSLRQTPPDSDSHFRFPSPSGPPPRKKAYSTQTRRTRGQTREDAVELSENENFQFIPSQFVETVEDEHENGCRQEAEAEIPENITISLPDVSISEHGGTEVEMEMESGLHEEEEMYIADNQNIEVNEVQVHLPDEDPCIIDESLENHAHEQELEDEIDVSYEISTQDDGDESAYPFDNFDNEDETETEQNEFGMITHARSLTNGGEMYEEDDCDDELSECFIIPDADRARDRSNEQKYEDVDAYVADDYETKPKLPRIAKASAAKAIQKRKRKFGRKWPVVTKTPKYITSKSQTTQIKTEARTAKIYTCQDCEKEFKYEGSFLKHRAEFHGKTASYSCDKCGESFPHKLALGSHLNAVHPNPSNSNLFKFKCDQCEKAFIHSGSLVSHKTLHTDPDRLTCHICDRIFNRYSDKKRHMINVHSKLSRRGKKKASTS